ncbi:MAG: sodium:alanine symporter family protein [Bacteroidales bacterium]|nr:sodium:alanine symporter family protein [Clostridium sp.]MCM1203244.1 sodium:alanine symporter family protein [Bacteroidales bacterium]
MNFSEMVSAVDDFVWGPVMLVLLVGTGIFLTIRTGFLPWRNLPYALKSTLSKEARTKSRGEGDVSPFSALTTALAATIGTGNIVGVATAMVSGGPGALVWMWVSACFGLTSKFSECMLAIKYREVNEKGEMSGGPMYTMKKALKNKTFGSVLGWLFALFTVVASFGIGNMTQANSIASALNETFDFPMWIVGIVITVLALLIIVGGIKSISKVSSVVVPLMAIFYVICGLMVIIGNIENVPSGVATVFSMAFSVKAVSGGALGTVVASLMGAMRYGVARGVFSNEAGMGSAAITAAAATTDNPVRQGYINMTGTFWDTIVVCTITGLAIASSGVLGMTKESMVGTYAVNGTKMVVEADDHGKTVTTEYDMAIEGDTVTLTAGNTALELTPYIGNAENIASGVTEAAVADGKITGTWQGNDKNVYNFGADGSYVLDELIVGSSLTIQAFKTVLGSAGGWLVAIGIALFAFSTILGWEYHGEKAFEYILGTHKFNMIYRVFFSAVAYVGATQTLDLVWNLSDIANALMAIPNLICMLLLSGEIARDMKEFQKVIKEEKAAKKAQ